MTRVKGTFSFAASFEPEVGSPIDARLTVATQQDLLSQATWQAHDGNTYAYVGMPVVVTADTDTSKRGLYILMNDNFSILSNWWNVTNSIALANEIQARIDGDAALALSISNESSARTQAINAINSILGDIAQDIDDEIQARRDADTVLEGDIEVLQGDIVELHTLISDSHIVHLRHIVTNAEEGQTFLQLTNEYIHEILMISYNGSIMDDTTLTVNTIQPGSVAGLPELNEGDFITFMYRKRQPGSANSILTLNHYVTSGEDNTGVITIGTDEIIELLSIAIDGAVFDDSLVTLNAPTNGSISGLPILQEGSFIKLLYRKR